MQFEVGRKSSCCGGEGLALQGTTFLRFAMGDCILVHAPGMSFCKHASTMSPKAAAGPILQNKACRRRYLSLRSGLQASCADVL